MAEQIILDIQIPTDNVQKAEQEIGRMRGTVEKLRAANKELDKSSEAYTKNTIEIKRLSGEIRTNERVLVANTKAQKANEGSIEQLRQQLSTTTSAWVKLSKEERENTKEGIALTKQKKDLTEELKRLEKATGDTRRNVGNYSEGMKEALTQSGLFTREQQALAIAQKAVATATAGTTKGLKLLRIALIATGIGAIVVAVGSLTAAFLSTQRGMDAVNRVLKPITFAFQRLIGVFQNVATALVDLNFKKVWDELRGISSALKEGAKDGSKFAKSQEDIKKAQLALAKVQGDLQRSYAQQRSILENVTKADEERRKAGEEALKALEKESQLRIAIKKEEIKQAALLAGQNDTDYDAKIALAQVQGELAEIEAQTLEKAQTVKNQINSIDKKLIDNTHKQVEATKELNVELEKQAEITKTFTEGIERANDEFLLQQKKLLLEGEISRDQYNQRLLEKEIELQEGLLAAARFTGEETLQFETELTDKRIALKELLANVEKEKAAANQDLTVAQGETEFDVAKQGVDVVKQAAGENVAVNKAAALAQAGINIAQAITKVSAETGVLAPIFTAITAALGAVQTAKIRSTKVPAFADGVIGVDGPGTGTSDSIDAKISKGESVITAKATSYFAPELANMERAVGNRPNIQLGNKRFANGIIAAGTNPGLQSGRNAFNQQQRLVSDLRNMRMFLSLTELEERQTEFNQAKSKAEITELG